MPEFKNPSLDNQGPAGGGPGGGDFRSMLLMFTVILAVFFAFQYFKPTEPAPTSPQPAAQKQQQAAQPVNSAPAAFGGSTAAAPGSSATPAVTASAETETTVENELYRIVFTNRGALVKHWILKKFNDASGKPLDLVQPQLADQFGLPLSFFTYEPNLTAQLNQALYQSSSSGTLLAPGTLTYHYAQGGLDVVKTFRFDSSYVIGIETVVLRNGAPVRTLVDWPAGLGDMDEFSGAQRSTRFTGVRTPSQLNFSINGRDDTIAGGKVSGNATTDQPYDFAGISDLYFGAAFLPDTPARTTVVTQHNTIELSGNPSDSNSQKRQSDVLGLAMGDTSGVTHVRLFVGPKQTDVLKSVHATGADGKPSGPSLEPLIQYGWLGIIAKPLYWVLRWLYNLLGSGAYSWGWAIIIFTFVFNLIFLPMRVMMTKSSLKMARIQHKVDALKRKYAHLKINDPKRSEMNTEMMALYKEENINPYGSCLPLLLQMPLFFAYYRVLYNAVELRQAHWFWLTDLSTPDPLHILPICIIITMFVVQYISPAMGMDRSQQRMMAFVMPLFMGFILWSYASGLALYWITGNLMNLAIQFGINQSHMGKELHAIAERRAQKKTGGTRPRVIEGRR